MGDGTKTVGDASSEDGNQVFVGTTEGKIYKLPLPRVNKRRKFLKSA